MASKSNKYSLAAAAGIGSRIGEAAFHAARHCATSNGGPGLLLPGSARVGCREQAADPMHAIHTPASCIALRVKRMPPGRSDYLRGAIRGTTGRSPDEASDRVRFRLLRRTSYSAPSTRVQ